MEYPQWPILLIPTVLVTLYLLAAVIKLETSVSIDWGEKHLVDVKANWWSGNHTPLNPSTNKKCEKQQLHSADDWQANLRVSFLIKGKYWFEQSTLQTQINNQTHNSFIFFPKSFKHCYLTLAALKILCHKQLYE